MIKLLNLLNYLINIIKNRMKVKMNQINQLLILKDQIMMVILIMKSIKRVIIQLKNWIQTKSKLSNKKTKTINKNNNNKDNNNKLITKSNKYNFIILLMKIFNYLIKRIFLTDQEKNQ